MTDSKELKAREKQEVAAPGEPTRPGLVFTPEVDIFETEKEITLLADMPGVTTDGICIDLRDGVLTLSGEVKPRENAEESDVLIEFEIGKYYRQFTLSDSIDQNKIEAKLADGVLRLTLPKAEKLIRRQIAITAG
jgi:HSP20 family molecular chaperone IbpA